jgi:hypothetical protein
VRCAGASETLCVRGMGAWDTKMRDSMYWNSDGIINVPLYTYPLDIVTPGAAS